MTGRAVRRFGLFALVSAIAGLSPAAFAQPNDLRELPFRGLEPPGPRRPIEALHKLPNALVVEQVGTDLVLHRWDGGALVPIPGSARGIISAAVHDSTLMVLAIPPERIFDPDQRASLQTWDGNTWSAELPSPPVGMRTLVSAGDVLYAAGARSRDSGPMFARLDRDQWRDLPVPDSLEGHRASLIAGGGRDQFLVHYQASGSFVGRTFLWNGSTWVATRVDEPVATPDRALVWWRGGWTAAGEEAASAGPVVQLWRLKESRWVRLSDPIPGRFAGLGVDGEDLFVAGVRSTAGVDSAEIWAVAPGVARIVAVVTGLGGDVSRALQDVATWHEERIWCGSFASFNRIGAWNAVREREGSFEPLWSGSAIDDEIEKLTPFGSGVAAAGQFNFAGIHYSPGVALWSGSEWEPIPERPLRELTAAKEYRGALVVAGAARAGEARNSQIEVWQAGGWHRIGNAEYGRVTSLAVMEGDLIAVGDFNSVNGQRARAAAVWDGLEWRSMGPGLRGRPQVALAWDAGVAVGGQLFGAGNYEVAGVANWDGSDWYPLGGGLLADTTGGAYSADVRDLAMYGDLLVAAGDIAFVGNVVSKGIAIWDGVAWRAFAQGEPDGVRPQRIDMLAATGARLWAFGLFLVGREDARTCLCSWDGRSWRLSSYVPRIADICATADGSLWIAASRPEALLPGAMRYDLLRLAPEDAPRLIGRPSILSIDALGPIPARGSLDVRYSLTRNAPLRYGLYNVGGRRIVEIDGGVQAAGPHAIHIDAESLSLPLILSGVYFLRIEAGDDVVSRRIVVVR